MLLRYALPTLTGAEATAQQTGDITQVLQILRRLTIDDFGLVLLGMPNPAYPGLSKVLPRMASADIQVSWTGAEGYTLLRQTLTFVRIVSQTYMTITNRPLDHAKVLDFGCGWGRIIRLIYYYTDPERICGCDPSDQSIDICRRDGVLGHLALSDYLPSQLPFAAKGFDLVYAFSVFTHLSERATSAAFAVLAEVLTDAGVLVVSLRPFEYWRFQQGLSAADIATLEDAHTRRGFAFRPHNRPPVDGDITYGDTSMSLDYLTKVCPGLRLRKIERSLDDPYQLICFLTR